MGNVSSDNIIQGAKDALEESKKTVHLYEMRFTDQQERIETLEKERGQTNELIKELMRKVSDLQSGLQADIPA